MKKLLLIFSFSFVLKLAQSQIIFCAPGAEWHYSFLTNGLSTYDNEHIKYVRDSIIGNETVKVLKHKRFFESYNNYYVFITVLKQVGDTVFMRNILTKHNWQILYNFATLPGQSWKTSVYQYPNSTVASTTTITVDSINFININNFNLKRLFVKYSQPGTQQYITKETITERLGCDKFLFNYFCPFHSTALEFIFESLCYQDNSFGLKQFSSKPCNYTDYVSIDEGNKLKGHIKIYPNPATDFFAIELEVENLNGKSNLIITDLCGMVMQRETINDLNMDSQKIDIRDLNPGIYILTVSNNNMVVYKGKLVKQN